MAYQLTTLSCFFAGLLFPLALAPFYYWPLALLAIAWLFHCLTTESSPFRAFTFAYLFGLGKFAFGMSYVYISVRYFSIPSEIFALLVVGIFVSLIALQTGVLGYLYVKFFRLPSLPVVSALGFCALATFLDWFVSFVTILPATIFLGESVVENSLSGYLPFGGVYLATFFMLLTATFLYITFFTKIAAVQRVGCAICVIALFAGGKVLQTIQWSEPLESYTVALVQANIDQADKWIRSKWHEHRETYFSLTQEVLPYADIIIWPEAAITVPYKKAGFIKSRVRHLLKDKERAAFISGALDHKPLGRYNMIFGMGDASGVYRKRELVPFGEYVPFEKYLGSLFSQIGLGIPRALEGAYDQPNIKVFDYEMAMAICYEAIYSQLLFDSVSKAHVLTVVSNDAWFGDSLGPYHNLGSARVRAIEFGRYVLRSSGSGVTAIIDPTGLVVSRLPLFKAGALVDSFQMMSGSTPILKYGIYPVLALMLFILVIVAFLRWRNIYHVDQ